MTTRVLLLDRDGVLNVDRPNYVLSVEELLLLPDVGEALALLSAFTIVVITNQACLGKGLLTQAGLETIHAQLQSEIVGKGGRIDHFYSCPHTDAMACCCRKPKPGLLLQAQAAYGFIPEQTWYVGDAGRDIEAAVAAGCRPALVLTGKGEKTSKMYTQVPTFANLLAFAQFLAPS